MRLLTALLVSLSLAAPAMAQSRPFVKADGLVYLSTVSGTSGDTKAQTTQVLGLVEARLKEAGSSLANVASVLVTLKKGGDVAAMNEAFAQAWPSNPPARTTIVVDQLATAAALIEMTVVAIPAGGERVVIQPAGWMKPTSPYSYGIKSGSTLFLAGIISRNGATNAAVEGDITVQTKTVLDNVAVVLKEAGMTMADVVSSKVFIADETTFQAMNNVYRTYFPASPPARATVKAGGPGASNLIEITMVAVKDPGRKTITTPNADGTAGRPSPILSSAIQVGKRLYVAGLTGATPVTKDDVKAQTTEVMTRLERTMKAAGYAWSDVVETTLFVPQIGRAGEVDAALRPALPDGAARVLLGTPLMGGDAAVEIMLTAVKP